MDYPGIGNVLKKKGEKNKYVKYYQKKSLS